MSKLYQNVFLVGDNHKKTIYFCIKNDNKRMYRNLNFIVRNRISNNALMSNYELDNTKFHSFILII